MTADPSPNPANLRIVYYPAAVLRKKAAPVALGSTDLSAVAARMLELMHDAEGIGLAAPQVGLPIRMFVVDIPSNDERTAEGELPTATNGPEIYINPVISKPLGPPEASEEGCLSLPDIRGQVLRPPTVTIHAYDLKGKEFTRTATGLLARCWQHELDHLDGTLILDRMTQMSRLRNRAAIRDLERGV